MAAQTDFWGDLIAADVRTPVVILREQAALLGTKTKNLVEAAVESQVSGRGFRHEFNIVVPALDNYTYRLFSIEHGVDLYPVQVGALKLETEQEFTDWLRKKLSSPETKKIIGNLLAQVSG